MCAQSVFVSGLYWAGQVPHIWTKSKIIKKNWTPRKIQNGKSLIKCQNQMIKHIKQMDNNCDIPDLVQILQIPAFATYKNSCCQVFLWFNFFITSAAL